MDKILVPTDFSPHALAAFDAAVSISRKTGASVQLFHVIEVPDSTDIQKTIVRSTPGDCETLTAIDERLRSLVTNEAYRDTCATYSIDFGIPYQQICGKAKNESFDLIVTGSHGIGRLEAIMFGSTAQKVVSHARCPVLIIHESATCFAPSNIAFGTGIPAGEACGRDTLELFATLYNATVHLVRVSTKAKFETARQSKTILAAMAKTFGLQQYTINSYNDECVESGLLHFAEDSGADLIFIPTHGKTELRHLLRKSVAGAMTMISCIPVLTCRIPDR
jgi:nucleotide-binding universal stress UspA family protein